MLLTAALAAPTGAAAESRPVVLVFDTVQGEGIDKTLAKSATKALCTYLRDSGRVEAIAFDRESPTVLRAIMDKQLTADQVASYSSQDERVLVAKALSYDYAAGSEVSTKDGLVTVKVWIAKVNGSKKDRWQAESQASTGTTGDRGLDNAMQSATSATVINVSRQAFLGLPDVPEKEPSTDAQTTAIGADLVPAPKPPTASDYAGQADVSLQSRQYALAIQQYQQAVNADPTNGLLRLKLADAYGRKGMYDEASAEIDRAAKMGAAADLVASAKDKLGKMRSGESTGSPNTVKSSTEPPPSEPPKTESTKPEPQQSDQPSDGTPAPSAQTDTTQPPASAASKMRDGDKLWRANQPDEAADAYREAIKLSPTDWRAYERLALVDASMSLFGEARTALEQLAKVQPSPSAAAVTSRYQLFSKVFEQWFQLLFKQLDRDSSDYEKKIISRESYYSSVKGLGLRLESMAKFLDVLPCPDDKKQANLHRSLACGLLTQAASSLQDYLETNSADSKSNADTFIAQAKKELDNVAKLEVGKTADTSQ